MSSPPVFPLRALISVSDKTGLADFAKTLAGLGFQIVSTGGTRKFLLELGLAVQDIAEYTGFPEMMDGRVKTLHPKVHGGLLGRPTLVTDWQSMTAHGILPFQIVVCNLYPFEKTVADPNCPWDHAIENIDIGGPSMIRSASKNHAHVAVVTSPEQYAEVSEAVKAGRLDEALRRKLATAAFALTARYDAAIATYLERHQDRAAAEAERAAAVANAAAAATATTTSSASKIATTDDDIARRLAWPPTLRLTASRQSVLRYGENPHQKGALYVMADAPAASIVRAEVLHGKELSYNNWLDLDAAYNLAREFSEPVAVVIKHNNPCGAGVAATVGEAFRRAYDGDPVSAFGSILAFNRGVDEAVAEQLCLPDRFIEAIVAPDYTAAAFQMLTTKPKWKGSVRLLKLPGFAESRPASNEFRAVTGGVLMQERDDHEIDASAWKVVTAREPTVEEWSDLKFVWRVAKHVKSNAIVFAKAGSIVGVGAGQMSRVDSCRIAAEKAGPRARGAAVGSDAFFPFRDGVDLCAKAGATAIIQPGGSRNDHDAITACNEQGLTMILTGRRHFRH